MRFFIFFTREQIHFHLVTLQQFKSRRGAALHGLCSVASAGRLLQNWQEPPLLPRIARSPRHPGVVRFATRSRCVFLTHTPQHISCPDSTQFQLECRHLHFKKSCALPLIPETPLIDPTHRRQSNGLGWRPSRHARRAQVLLSATPTGSQMQEAPGQLQKGDSDVGCFRGPRAIDWHIANGRTPSLE